MAKRVQWPRCCETCRAWYGPGGGYSTECKSCYLKRRYREDPKHREACRKYLAAWLKRKKQEDPAWAEDYRERVRQAGVRWRARKRETAKALKERGL